MRAGFRGHGPDRGRWHIGGVGYQDRDAAAQPRRQGFEEVTFMDMPASRLDVSLGT